MKLKDFLNEVITKEYYHVVHNGKVVSALFPSTREAKLWLHDRANIPKDELKDYKIKPAKKKKSSIREASKEKDYEYEVHDRILGTVPFTYKTEKEAKKAVSHNPKKYYYIRKKKKV